MKRATAKPATPETVVSDDILTDFEELTADYTKPKLSPEDEAVKELYSEWVPDDKENAKVKIYKWNGSLGWYWEVKFPIQRTRRGTTDWTYDRYSGYAVTKVGAKYSVKRAFHKFEKEQQRETSTIEYKVPIAASIATNSRRTGIIK